MRKQTKLVAVLSAAALLAIGASMTSFAAKGWTQEDGQWYYYDNSGDYVTGEWKKSGNNYFYLGDEGYMLTNALIEDGSNYYYVDANGAMVKNQWVQIAADDSEEQDVEYRWYRFGSTGRALRATSGDFAKKTVDGKKYAFDGEGKMLFGFVTDDGDMLNLEDDPVINADFYFGSNEDGAMYTGWLQYTEGVSEDPYSEKDSLWFYFNPVTGEKYQDAAKNKKIGKYYYKFDSNGVMQTGWTETATKTVGNRVASYNKYFSGSDEGWMQKNTWVWAVPSAKIDYDDNQEDNSRWFYVDAKGETVTGITKKIKSKYYVFDNKGRMQAGLVELAEADKVQGNTWVSTLDLEAVTGDEIANNAVEDVNCRNLFYFGNDEENDGSMKTGNNIKIELADDVYTFGFSKNGGVLHGLQNKGTKLYLNGILQTAGDMRYAVKEYDGQFYVVGSTGTIVKKEKTAKDADDNYYAVNKKGEVAFFYNDEDYTSREANAWAEGKTFDISSDQKDQTPKPDAVGAAILEMNK